MMITDARGCQNTFTHAIIEPDEIGEEVTATNFDLSISESITGGIGPYAYEWVEEYTSGVLTTANTHTVSYNGNYSLIVTDEGAINNPFCSVESNAIPLGQQD